MDKTTETDLICHPPLASGGQGSFLSGCRALSVENGALLMKNRALFTIEEDNGGKPMHLQGNRKEIISFVGGCRALLAENTAHLMENSTLLTHREHNGGIPMHLRRNGREIISFETYE